MDQLYMIFDKFLKDFYTVVVENNRWQMYLTGLGNTICIALVAVFIGTMIGLIVAIIKYYAVNNKKLWLLDKLCDLYITVIRGTPTLIQILIMYTVILSSVKNGVPVAMLAFGINSGAYVAEIIRAGILSVDKGQSEAGRSLGLNSNMTMTLIILPQAVKNILPALFNEFIVLLKETSVAGYIAVQELTKSADLIRGRTFIGLPLFISAGLYLIMVVGMTALQKRLERRLAKGDNR
ncbi:amino acid ABC transporter permease [Acetanaerobacterium elongatum]|uniref:Polar amino acid transport system permease protein/polar amino acid transport system substrate-binding protein n=1 Tax=Acetanaerobacterium elongatum TaxID=258515 RepID=A0A1H0BTT3_9FIRM|nr:amino acid ABC transporter permease [Acetanaerobacterium elongatum]SDN48996.1 polar amino acid transport system permease protein/polar amino acid transport system substrate-binding protein [Acetanaerobacterium elongatum]